MEEEVVKRQLMTQEGRPQGGHAASGIRETDPLPRIPEETHPRRCFNFIPVRSISNFWLPELSESTRVWF